MKLKLKVQIRQTNTVDSVVGCLVGATPDGSREYHRYSGIRQRDAFFKGLPYLLGAFLGAP